MSYFAIAIEPDLEVRTLFLRKSRKIAVSLGLPRVRVLEIGPCAAVFAAPFDAVLNAEERKEETNVLLGYALDKAGKPSGPSSLGDALKADSALQPDGFFVFVRMTIQGEVELCADPMGCLPCYYAQPRPGSFVCASGPGDLLAHPGVRSKPDPEGIAGLLLLNNPLYDRSLFQGVFRLPQRTRLKTFGADLELRTIPYADQQPPQTKEETLERLEALWRKTFDQHVAASPGETDCLLSGGRDSRMIAGELMRLGVDFRAVTLGKRGENEVRAARMANRALRIRDHILHLDGNPASMLRDWRRRTERESATTGGTTGGVLLEHPTRPWIHHGLLVDDVVGGLATGFAYDAAANRFGGDIFFSRYNRWGFPTETLSRLFRDPYSQDLPRILRERILTDFQTHAQGPHAASFDIKLATRCRYHLGSCLWGFTGQSWPVTPCASMELLSFCRDLPVGWTQNRELQMSLIERLNDTLVRIPFDGNQLRFVPTERTWMWPEWRQRLFAAKQPLRYHRVFSPESPAWLAVRKEAERGREALHDVFDPDVLCELWPPFPEKLPGKNPFADLAGLRNLMLMASCFSSLHVQ